MTWLKDWMWTAVAWTLAGLAVVGGVLQVLAGQRARGRREALQEVETNAWRQADEAEQNRAAADAGRDVRSARDRLRDLAKRRGEWPE